MLDAALRAAETPRDEPRGAVGHDFAGARPFDELALLAASTVRPTPTSHANLVFYSTFNFAAAGAKTEETNKKTERNPTTAKIMTIPMSSK